MLNGLTSISVCVQLLTDGLVDLVDRIAEAHIFGTDSTFTSVCWCSVDSLDCVMTIRARS